MLLGRLEARRLDTRAARRVGLVALHHTRLAQTDGLAVDLDGGLAFGVRDFVAEAERRDGEARERAARIVATLLDGLDQLAAGSAA